MKELTNNSEIRALPKFWAVSHQNQWPKMRHVYLDKSDSRDGWWYYYERGLDFDGFRHYAYYLNLSYTVIWFYDKKEDAIRQFKHLIAMEITNIQNHEKYWLNVVGDIDD